MSDTFLTGKISIIFLCRVFKRIYSDPAQKQYIGSAYGEKGIFGRWSEYVNTHHGGNKELINLLEKEPERYKNFRFTILKIFSEGATEKEVRTAEDLYKAKLGTFEFGLNDN